MGSDLAIFFSNLFLYCFQNRRLKDLQRKGLTNTKKLYNVFHFIDDLNAIIDADGIFESNFRGIFPEELELHRDNSNDSGANFLHLGIKMNNNKFQINLL